MYPRKKLCLSDETMESDSKITTGILVISIGFIFIALIFGFWGAATIIDSNANHFSPYSENDKNTFDSVREKSLEESFSNLKSSDVAAGFGLNDVSIAEECDWPCLSVEAGKISLYDYNFPDQLPVCITNTWLEGKSITLCVYGGYEPMEGGIVCLDQMKDGGEGIVDIHWTPQAIDCPCGAVLWTATFSVDAPIVLDSNHVPDILINDCIYPTEGPEHLSKWVTATFSTQWHGCDTFCVAGSVCGLDVEPGLIKLCDHKFPEELPICLTNDIVNEWYIDLCVYGGYEFCSGDLNLLQQQTELSGKLNMHATASPTGCPCGAECVRITFSIEGDDPIVFASNKVPEMEIDGFCASGPDELGKRVCLDANMIWSGCGDEEQQFMLISAQKVNVPKNPNFRFVYTSSPVLT